MLCLKLVSHMGVWLFFGILFLSGEVPTKDNSSLKPFFQLGHQVDTSLYRTEVYTPLLQGISLIDTILMYF